MFSGSAVLCWLTVILQVSERSRWSKSSARFHTHTHTHSECCDSLVSGEYSQVSDRCPSLMLSSSSFCTHTHTHPHSSRCVSVVVLLMYSTASVYRSSWLITSCFLFLTRLLPAHRAAWIQAQRHTTDMSQSLKWMCNPTINPRPLPLHIHTERTSSCCFSWIIDGRRSKSPWNRGCYMSSVYFYS